MAYVYAPDGTPGEVPDEQAQQALVSGYTPRQPSADEMRRKQAAEQPGQAALEGVARGVTMGFGDPILAQLQHDITGKPRVQALAEMKARKEENPIASTAGELGGVLGTSLATGGGASALVGGGLKGAALEGGLYGLGGMVSEKALANQELTSDNLAAGLVGGALASGAAHGAFSLLGKGVSAGLSKFGGGSLKDTLSKAADDAEFSALRRAGGKKWGDLNEPFAPEMLKFGREKGILGKVSTAFDEKTAQKAQEVASEYATKIGSHMNELESRIPLKSNYTMRMGVVNKLEQVLDDEFGKNPVFDEAMSGAKRITQRIADENLTWPELWDIQSSLFKDVPVTGLSPASAQVRETIRKTMRDYVFDDIASAAADAGQLPAGFGGMMRKTGREARAAMSLSKALTQGTAKLDTTGTFGGASSFGALAGLATGNVAPVLGGIAGDLAKSQFNRRGAFLGAAALRAIADSPVTGGVSSALSQHLGVVLPSLPAVYRYPLSLAAAKGADALLQEHVRLASSDQGQHYLSSVALPAETEQEIESAGQRLAVLDHLENSTVEHQNQLAGAIDALFGTASGRKASVAAPIDLKAFKLASESIRKIVSDPTAAFEAVPENIRAGAPATAASAAAKIVQMAQFLDSKMPKDPNEGLPSSVATTWEPSKADLDKFHRYKEAVENPARVLKNMAAGYIAPEQVEALRAVYPALYQKLQQQISERLLMQKKPISYQQRLAMAAIIGPQALGMTQQQMVVLQQTQVAPKNPAPPPRPDGRQDVNVQDNLDTQATRLERR